MDKKNKKEVSKKIGAKRAGQKVGVLERLARRKSPREDFLWAKEEQVKAFHKRSALREMSADNLEA